jgi:hypothetical protein
VKVLLDEDLPHKLRTAIPNHDVSTVAYLGWKGLKRFLFLKRGWTMIPIFRRGRLAAPHTVAAVLLVCTSMTGKGQRASPYFASFSVTQSSDAPQRTVVRGRGFATDPIRIIAILYDGKPIQSSVPFAAPDDWLSHLDVEIRNASSKNLLAGDIELAFRDSAGTFLYREIPFGVIPDSRPVSSSDDMLSRSPVSVLPGTTITLRLKYSYPMLAAELSAKRSLSQVNWVGISYGVFYFADGLRWAQDNDFARQDPAHPGKYVPTPRTDLMPAP